MTSKVKPFSVYLYCHLMWRLYSWGHKRLYSYVSKRYQFIALHRFIVHFVNCSMPLCYLKIIIFYWQTKNLINLLPTLGNMASVIGNPPSFNGVTTPCCRCCTGIGPEAWQLAVEYRVICSLMPLEAGGIWCSASARWPIITGIQRREAASEKVQFQKIAITLITSGRPLQVDFEY